MRQLIMHVALVVRDYDEAIEFFCRRLRFTLVEDTYQPEQDKRWVTVAPPGSNGTTLLLARASKPEQESFIGNQAGGRGLPLPEHGRFLARLQRHARSGDRVRPAPQDRGLRDRRRLPGPVRQLVGSGPADRRGSRHHSGLRGVSQLVKEGEARMGIESAQDRLRDLARSTSSFFDRFQVAPRLPDPVEHYMEEAQEFAHAAKAGEGKSRAAEEAADVLVTVMGVCSAAGPNTGDLVGGIYAVIAKNDAKTPATHEYRDRKIRARTQTGGSR